jgi:Arylsulfotransferase (ASST)
MARLRTPAAALALLLAIPCSAAAKVSITGSPAIQPQFKASVPDYVSRCVAGQPLHLTIRASNGDTVGVAGQPKRSGDFTVDVSRQTGEDVPVSVRSGGHSKTHHIRCLPLDFPGWTVHRHGNPQAQWYVLTPIGSSTSGYVVVFDARGVPVWWMHDSDFGPWDGKLLPDGNMIWTRQFNDRFGLRDAEAWEEHRLDGTTVRTLETVDNPTDIHDIEQLPNGHYLLDAYRKRTGADLTKYGGPQNATVYDGEIQELDANGKLVWKWNSKGHISPAQNTWWDVLVKEQNKRSPQDRYYDLVHVNSVEPDGDGVVVSARFLDAVFRIDKKSGKITWKLGGTKTKKSLKVENDPMASHPLRGNHDARLYKDHTLTVFDNGTEPNRAPRVVRYRIDTHKRTAKLVEGFGQSDVTRSGWGGSARKLPRGNWVVYWGGTVLMTERTPSGTRVLDLEFKDGKHSYRAFPIPPGQLTAQALRQGMNAVAQSAAPRR